jgi:hypothetical protein
MRKSADFRYKMPADKNVQSKRETRNQGDQMLFVNDQRVHMYIHSPTQILAELINYLFCEKGAKILGHLYFLNG